MRRLILPTTSHSGPLKYGSLVSGLKFVRLVNKVKFREIGECGLFVGSLCQMTKSKIWNSCKLKQKKSVSGQCASFHHPGSLYLPLPPTLSSILPPTPLPFPPLLLPCLFPSWMVLLIFMSIPVNEQAVITTRLIIWPPGEICSQWLVVDGQAGAASALLRHLQEVFSSANHLRAYSMLWQTINGVYLNHFSQHIPTKLLFCICIVFML